MTSLFAEPVVFVDLETTGARPGFDRVTEIGVIEVHGDALTEWSTLVNPGCSIPPMIQSLTGITNAMVADAPAFADLAAALHERLHGRLLVAHNAQFDYGFLRAEFRRHGMEFRARTLCTVKLSRRLYPAERRHNLDSVIARLGIPVEGRHRALGDARVLARFLEHVQEAFDPDHLRSHVEAVLDRPAYPTYLPEGTLESLPDSPGVYLFYAENGAMLYVGKSVSLRSRVISHFSAAPTTTKGMDLSRQVRRLDYIETAGELGALLLEARLVKERAPLANRFLRKNQELCSFSLVEDARGALTAHLLGVDEAPEGAEDAGVRRYGLFRSRRQAMTALREIVKSHRLCQRVLGLEPGAKPGTPCFGRQIQTCLGACVGEEPIATHNLRVLDALTRLRLPDWPFRGRVGIREVSADGARTDIHVLQDWRWIGTAHDDAELAELARQTRLPAFDADIYKLLARYLARGRRPPDVVDLCANARAEVRLS